MTVEQMRVSISKVYDSWKWRNRVANMSSSQVIAIYKRMEVTGQLNVKKNKGEKYKQMTVFDYGKESVTL